MRRIWIAVAAASVLLAFSACGDDDGNGPDDGATDTEDAGPAPEPFVEGPEEDRPHESASALAEAIECEGFEPQEHEQPTMSEPSASIGSCNVAESQVFARVFNTQDALTHHRGLLDEAACRLPETMQITYVVGDLWTVVPAVFTDADTAAVVADRVPDGSVVTATCE